MFKKCLLFLLLILLLVILVSVFSKPQKRLSSDQKSDKYEEKRCPECGGRGYTDKVCLTCGGTGVAVITVERTCPFCNGSGEGQEGIRCGVCKGAGKLTKKIGGKCGVCNATGKMKCSICGGTGLKFIAKEKRRE